MNILIVKLAAIGDAVAASTMLPALKDKYKDVRITWLCGKEAYPVVETFTGVDEIICVDNTLLAKGKSKQIAFILSVWKALAGKKYDLVLNAHTDRRYTLMTLWAKARVKRQLRGRMGFIAGRCFSDEYARFALGHDHSFTESFPYAKPNIKLSANRSNMILLLPGGAKNALDDSGLRRWPVEHYKEVAVKLTDLGYEVGIIGSSGDLWVETAFKDISIKSYIGKTNIKELLELLSSSKCLISHDSGPLFMGIYTNTPVISLFGPVLPSSRLTGVELEQCLTSKISCSPCYDGKKYADCNDNICMSLITPDNVIDMLKTAGLI